jgi:hypothetical protein
LVCSQVAATRATSSRSSGESPSPPLQPLLAVADEGVGTRRPALGPGQPHQVGPAAGHEVDLPEDQGGADDHRPRVAGRLLLAADLGQDQLAQQGQLIQRQVGPAPAAVLPGRHALIQLRLRH